MNCVNCKNEIADGTEKCLKCGWVQKNIPNTGILIRECKHCEGSGQCRAGKTKGKKIDKTHSCEYCIKKAGIAGVKMESLFPIVPCGYCEGRGVLIIDLKPQVPKGGAEGKKPGGKYYGQRR